MGRPKTPIEKMARRSPDGVTPGKRHLPTPYRGAIERTVPEPPVPLSGRAEVEWRNIWEAGFWLKRDQDYPWVEMIARAYMDIETFREEVEKTGLIVKGYAGQMTANPLLAEIRKAEATIQKCLQVLGFSPTDRAKLAITEAKARNALQEMIESSQR